MPTSRLLAKVGARPRYGEEIDVLLKERKDTSFRRLDGATLICLFDGSCLFMTGRAFISQTVQKAIKQSRLPCSVRVIDRTTALASASCDFEHSVPVLRFLRGQSLILLQRSVQRCASCESDLSSYWELDQPAQTWNIVRHCICLKAGLICHSLRVQLQFSENDFVRCACREIYVDLVSSPGTTPICSLCGCISVQFR